MPALTEKQIDKISQESPLVFWDGWEAVFCVPDGSAIRKNTGRYINGAWYNAKRVQRGDNGKYFVPKRFLPGIGV